MKKYILSEEEQANYEESHNPFAFEKYCGSCDKFMKEECPNLDKFLEGTFFGETKWEEINCEEFWD